jgi:hypothetical protein
MPGSHTLLLAPLAGNSSAAVDFPGPGTSASTDQCDCVAAPTRPPAHAEAVPAEPRLTAPPGDVERLLQRYGTSLPQYLDVQRQRAVARSRQRWPVLQACATGEPTR